MNKIRKCPRCHKEAERTPSLLVCKKCNVEIPITRNGKKHIVIKRTTRTWEIGTQEVEDEILAIRRNNVRPVRSKITGKEYEAKKHGDNFGSWTVRYDNPRETTTFCHEDFCDLFELLP